ncbi:MAG: hypothetical protein LUF68_07155 [Clostridiales bacterium]|nr:hypothetical protein [Clostridiales bacterium]
MLLDVYEGENQTLRFDYTEEIAEANFKTTSYTVPEAANCGLNLTSATGATGATGVVFVSASDKTNTTDLFINAYVASDELTVSGVDIVSATKIYGDIKTPLTVSDGQFSFTPETITVENQIDEIIQATLTDGTICELPATKVVGFHNPFLGIKNYGFPASYATALFCGQSLTWLLHIPLGICIYTLCTAGFWDFHPISTVPRGINKCWDIKY